MRFVVDNVWLIVALLASGAYLLWPEVRRLFGASHELGTLQTIQLMNQRNALVLDVREESERGAGHIPSSKHIALAVLPTRLKELEKYKDRPIIVSCRSGARSASACGILRKQGFNEVYQLKGGILAWQQANLPLEKQ